MDLKVNNINSIAFTAIKYNMVPGLDPNYARDVDDAVKSRVLPILNDAEWDEFMQMVESQKDNPVDVVLFGRNRYGKLSGMIFYPDDHNGIANKHSQYLLFESPLSFIKRMVQYAEKEKDRILKTLE